MSGADGRRENRPALGTPGEPGPWVRAQEGAGVPLARSGFGDAGWSFLYKPGETGYAAAEPAADEIAESNRRMRAAPMPDVIGPVIKRPVWTWEVPVYFWVGGMASGASFMALACDAAGDRRSAAIARKLTLGVVMPAPALLIADLGRPGRFLNMLRIVKTRSPMNMGAWCLVAFSASATGAVGADVLRRPRAASALGALSAVLGGYLGSYTGVLLACTAVPVWARSRSLLGPIFVCTATATGAAATRLTLVARGLPAGHPTRSALRGLETGAMLAELALSIVNERRLGRFARPLRSGRRFRVAQAGVLAGLGAQVAARRRGEWAEHAASALFLAGGLAFRFAWVHAGRVSAADDAAVAALARTREGLGAAGEADVRVQSLHRRPLPAPGRRLWGELVRRASLAIEARVRG